MTLRELTTPKLYPLLNGLLFACFMLFGNISMAEDETETPDEEAGAETSSSGPTERAPLLPKSPDRSEVEGEIVKLQAVNQPFAAIYNREITGFRKGAVLIAHGDLEDMDTPELIRPLRLAFPNHGWDSMSLELLPQASTKPPIPPRSTSSSTSANTEDSDTATEEETVPAEDTPSETGNDVSAQSATSGDNAKIIEQNMQRLEAGINHLAAQGNGIIVLIGHKSGAYQIAEWAARHANPQVRAMVFVDGKFNAKGQLPPIQFSAPILDLIFEHSDKNRRRIADAKRNKLYYFQIITPKVPSWQEPQVHRLVSRIRGWLKKQLTSSGKATYRR